MKTLIFYSSLFFLTSCVTEKKDNAIDSLSTVTAEEENINLVLDSWHRDAAQANGPAYFEAISEGGIFIGTDATENWEKEDFKKWSQPYFNRGKAWNFTSIDRNVYFSSELDFAWFDELLSTQMKMCRGSGVLEKEHGKWKIKHYVLSMTIPNEIVDSVVSLKSSIEDSVLALY